MKMDVLPDWTEQKRNLITGHVVSCKHYSQRKQEGEIKKYYIDSVCRKIHL